MCLCCDMRVDFSDDVINAHTMVSLIDVLRPFGTYVSNSWSCFSRFFGYSESFKIFLYTIQIRTDSINMIKCSATSSLNFRQEPDDSDASLLAAVLQLIISFSSELITLLIRGALCLPTNAGRMEFAIDFD